MNCSQRCDHLLSLTALLRALHERSRGFDLGLALTVGRIGLCLGCTSALRDHPLNRTDALEAMRKLHAALLPPIEEENLQSMAMKLPWAHAENGTAATGSIYPQIVFDPEGNPFNVVIHVGRAGRGMGATKAAIGLLVHKLLEWGCPPEEVARTLIGHASAAGPARWRMGNRFIHSLEDGVGQVLRLATVGRVVGEFLRQYGDG